MIFNLSHCWMDKPRPSISEAPPCFLSSVPPHCVCSILVRRATACKKCKNWSAGTIQSVNKYCWLLQEFIYKLDRIWQHSVDRVTAHHSLLFSHDDLQWHSNLIENTALPEQKCAVCASLLSKINYCKTYLDSEKNYWSLEVQKYLSAGHHLFDAAKLLMWTAVTDVFRANWTELGPKKNIQKITWA